jgi:glutathione S-transferase
MKLRGSIVSPYVARVVMCARAMGLRLESAPVEGAPDLEPRDANPLTEIPLLELDGRSLADAEAICDYLEETHPARTLRPKDPLERAQVRLMTREVDELVLSPLGPLYSNLDPAGRKLTEVETALGTLHAGVRRLDDSMGRGPYAVGARLTRADCALLPAIALLNLLFIPAFRLKSPVQTLPKLREWWAQMGEDPLCVLLLQDWTMAFQESMRARHATRGALRESNQ